MKTKLFLIVLIISGLYFTSCTEIQNSNLSANISVDESVKKTFNTEGRLFLFLSQNPNVEPRTQIWPNPRNKTYIFAKNINNFNSNTDLIISHTEDWESTTEFTLSTLPKGEYYAQALWDQDTSESRTDAPGNIYSEKQKIIINEEAINFTVLLDKVIPKRTITEHNLAKVINLKSELLSEFWGKAMHLKASILLPHNYNTNKAYAIRYNVAGYGGRYTRINRLLNNSEFMKWWDSPESPQIITVFLDGEGPFGDSYQMDSDNSGPYGESLVKELIPYIENTYRGTDDMKTRFVDGCSTGGWVSLGLQLYYPDTFNGVFSYSPDSIEFENYQLVNIYADKNAFTNEFNYERPVMRNTMGEPVLALREFIQYENVLGNSNTYLNSGGQFSAHTALYSPKGDDGLPKPLFDPKTGVIDAEVAEHWKKYDFKLHAKNNWTTLGPKLQGKIYVWMGDMDDFYLNPATRAFDEFLKGTQNPKSDAIIEFSAMQGHCWQFSDRVVLEQIQERIDKL
ncbi:hypothetical protein D7030_02010 [Flavobacteriaceae bacterium AU392]|nr:hypothetical protein D1817_08485 [Flavobacteriaceae bacterium]RKM85471.1 hypothetical protein D7030_02010 [Flavobacteriaceae bacterium AU392]